MNLVTLGVWVILTIVKFDIPGLRAPKALKPSRAISFQAQCRVPRPRLHGPYNDSRVMRSTLSQVLVKAMGVSLWSQAIGLKEMPSYLA
jgi:hypothetical protein